MNGKQIWLALLIAPERVLRETIYIDVVELFDFFVRVDVFALVRAHCLPVLVPLRRTLTKHTGNAIEKTLLARLALLAVVH